MTTYNTYIRDSKSDFITECVMQVVKGGYLREDRHYLTEGTVNVKKLSEGIVKVYNTVKKFTGTSNYAKKCWKFINSKGALNLLPELAEGGFKYLKPDLCKKVVFNSKMAVVTIGDAIGAGTKCVQMTVKGTTYAMTEEMKNIGAAIVDLIDTGVSIITTCVGFIPGFGSLVAAVVNLAWVTIKNILKTFASEVDRIWAIVKDFIKSQIGISIDDIKAAWTSFKGWAATVGRACREWAKNFFSDPVRNLKGAATYGGTTAMAYREALDYAKKARNMLKSIPENQLRNRATWISCVYRKKKAWTQEELNRTLDFCKRLRNLEIPTYQEAKRKWPGIKGVDDGTYAKNVLSALRYTLVSNGYVVSWFKRSCDVAAMTFAQLQAEYKKLK